MTNQQFESLAHERGTVYSRTQRTFRHAVGRMIHPYRRTWPPVYHGVVLPLLSMAILLPLVGSCRDRTATPVNVVGSTSVQPFAELLAGEFVKGAATRNVDVQGGGSTAGLQALANGIADIAMCSRSLTKEEAAVFTAITIARDGLAIIVHPSNSMGGLTRQQVERLFSGDVRNWREIGGKDMPVRLIMREEGSGTREAFANLAMGSSRVSRKALVQESNGAVKELVRHDPAAIGYISLGLVGEGIKAVGIDGVHPSPHEVRTGQYKLSRAFLFVVRTDLRPQAQEFIDFVLSEPSQHLLEVEGLVRAQ